VLLSQLLDREVVVPDGTTGVEIEPDRAGEFQPQIAFLDIGLPKLNGFDLARRLRALGATADTILVAVTGWGQPSDRQKAKEAGFDDYLVKPVEIDRIRALLDSKQ